MIYDNIERYCKANKITIAELEKRCHIGNGTVSRWRDNYTTPSMKSLNKLMHYTKLPLSFWLS